MKVENERAELMEIEKAVEACNAVAVPDPIRAELVRDLGPVANALVIYSEWADLPVTNEGEAKDAADHCQSIATDIKAVQNCEVLSKITAGLHDLHRKWTGLRDLFVAPMERDRKTIKAKIIAWQESERRKAEEIQRKLQAEADAKAQREREKQEAEARRQRQIEETSRRKAEDARRMAAAAEGAERSRLEAVANAADRAASAAAVKAEAKADQAASVIAPTVTVVAPKSGLRTSKAWIVKSVDEEVFFAALAHNPALRGYVEIDKIRMARGKAANPSMTVPGVVFEQIVR